MMYETKFTFETFEAVSLSMFFSTLANREKKFANSEVTHSLLLYLSSYKNFSSSECMKRVVSLMYRQAIRAKAEGLFFNVRLF